MTQLLRQALADAESLSAVQRATGLKRQALAKFMRGEQSLRLDLADKLAEHFGIESRRTRRKGK
jgi:plasmid maintenance system antidote protein VapI